MENTAVKEAVEQTVEVAKEVIPEATEGKTLPDIVVVGLTLAGGAVVTYGGYKLVKWIGKKIKDKKNPVEPVKPAEPKPEEKTEEPAAEPEQMN